MNRGFYRRLALALIVVVGAALRLWNLGAGGAIIAYYLAGVRSMMQDRHNFFFNAFDPAGFVSLDKPPLAFWLQTASAKLLGFGTFAVLLPQVLEGLAAIALLYLLVRRHFGAAAGLLAALFLALNPVSVAVDRSNNTESCLVLVLLLATWSFFRALDTGRLRWLLASAALVGLGFNTKMLVAFGVVPVFALAYLVWSKEPAARRLRGLAAAAVVLAVVSLSWCVTYDLIPPNSRPYVDSTTDNSMLELAVGHNFVQRFVRPARIWRSPQAIVPAAAMPDPTAQPPLRDFAPAGPLRLAAPPLAAQIGWLFPLALIGAVAARQRRPDAAEADASGLALAVWGGWALLYGAVFGAAGGLFHAYYLAVMAPPVCALAAVGATRLLLQRHANAVIAATAFVATALWQANIANFYLAHSIALDRTAVLATLIGAAIVCAAALVALRARPVASLACVLGGLAVLLIAPATWSLGTSIAIVNAGFPSARPPFITAAAETRRARFNEIAGAVTSDPKLIVFLEQNHGGAPYLLAAVNARLAAPIIIATGAPVMALGGFNGQAAILGVDDFARLVAANQVRYALIGDGSEGLRRVFGEGAQRALTDWIREHGHLVDPAQWRSAAGDIGGRPAEGVGAMLYDLRPEPTGG